MLPPSARGRYPHGRDVDPVSCVPRDAGFPATVGAPQSASAVTPFWFCTVSCHAVNRRATPSDDTISCSMLGSRGLPGSPEPRSRAGPVGAALLKGAWKGSSRQTDQHQIAHGYGTPPEQCWGACRSLGIRLLAHDRCCHDQVSPSL